MKKIFIILCIFSVFTKGIFANIFDDAKLAEETGDKVQIVVPLYALWLTSANNDLVDGGGKLVISLLSTQAAVEVLKRVVREERPNGSNKLSFPSGHAAGAFSGATFIHKRYGIKQAIIPYALATYVGYSRVKAKKHYTHDVVAGALIAGGINYLLVDSLDKNQSLSLESAKSGFMLSYKKSF